MQNWVKKGQEGLRDLILKFWDPLHISGTVRGRNVDDYSHVLILSRYRASMTTVMSSF